MSVVSHGFSGGVADTPFLVDRSLRFRAAASPDLRRSAWSGSNRKTWTLSAWLKRGLLGGPRIIMGGYDGASANASRLYFDSSNRLAFDLGGILANATISNEVFRDPKNFFHLLFNYDSTQASASDRIRMKANGAVLNFTATAFPSLNQDCQFFIDTLLTLIAVRTGSDYYDGLISSLHLIMGQRLDASDFGETVNGVWVPKEYTGSYGTRGCQLLFDDPTNTTTIAQDSSGNGNNWTATNISVTPGTTYDSLTDTPTNNHCTLNSITVGVANLSNANLTSGTTAVRGTFNALAVNAYWEVTAGGSGVTAGVISEGGTTHTTTVTANKTFGFRTTTTGDLEYRNITDAGSWTGITTGLTGIRYPYGTGAAANWNFGQRAFTGSVPSGYFALNSDNIAAGAVTTSGTFTGNASTDGPEVDLGGNPVTMTINGNAVTWGTHADKLANGFKVRSGSASYNTAGSNTYSVSVAGESFYKPNRAQVNP